MPFINNGEHANIPEIPTLLSLAVILATLVITTAASLAKTASSTNEANPSRRARLELRS